MKQKKPHNILISLIYPTDSLIVMSQETYFNKVFLSVITVLNLTKNERMNHFINSWKVRLQNRDNQLTNEV